ncbi:MAG: tetratricopeptide repeat protein, partial [Acidobacteria bacterium]|nr:tetratricopeptide repeat protein [Acidobacteriota bacterium]
AVFVLLALGLAAKPMLVTLPFVFLLLDFWPLGRLQLPPADGAPADGPWRAAAARALRLALEKVPLLALSAASSVVTYLVQARGGSIASTEEHPLIARLSGVPIAYAAYLAKAVWPSDLAVFYPFVNRPWWQPVAAAGGLAALTALVIMSVRRRPYLAVGWFWFLGMLVPVIGLVQVGAQAMADRYTYVPLVGVFIMAAWGVADTAKAWCHRRKVLVPLGVATVAVCGVLAARQVSFWSDNETLWRRAAEATTHNGLAHNNLGAALQRRGLKEEALHHYREAVRLKPDYIDARNNLGGVLFNQDRFEEAAVHFAEAIRLDPSQARGYANLGAVLCRLGRNREALDVLRRAAALDPDLVDAHCNLAVALLTEGLTQEAMAHASQAARLNPALAAPQHNWGGALFVEGRLDEAAVHFREALRLQPDYVEAHAYLAACLLARGAAAEAAAHVREALRLKPDFAFARQLEAQIRSGVAPSPLTPLPAPSAGSTPAGGP